MNTMRSPKPSFNRRVLAAQAMQAATIGECRAVASEELPFEFMLNALRLNDGFSEECFESRTGLPLQAVRTQLEHAAGRGLMERGRAGWAPTSLGLRFLNDLQAAFLA